MKAEIKSSKFYNILCGVGKVADDMGYPCYVVGGFVRDLLLYKDNDDIDFVVEGSGLKIAQAVASFFNSDKLSLYESYGTAKVDVQGIELEFVGARKEFYHRESRNPIVEDGTIYDDMSRRDLTINDIAICLNSNHFGEIFDPNNGIKDLNDGIIRTPLDPNITFNDDPLRMLRAIRFACRFGFKFDDDTFKAICMNSDRINIITKERICDELQKMMRGNKPDRAFSMLQSTSLLKYILPEVNELADTKTSSTGRSHKNIMMHTISVLENVAKNTNDEWTRWAALFHDCGKIPTREWDPESENWTFEKHADVGSKMIPKIFKSLGLPQDYRMEKVKKLVSLHMRPMQLCANGVTDSAVRRLLFDAGEYIDDLMIICNADITSHNKCKVDAYRDNYKLLIQRMKELEESDHLRNFQPPVDGNEIMEMFNLTPCREVGILKELVKNAILDGLIPNEHDKAKEFIIKQYEILHK